MKDLYPGFYRLSDGELASIWQNATFIFDTNALLNLYRYVETAREDFFRVLDGLFPRLWIPYHVGLEFQRGRLSAIAGEKKALVEALSTVEATSAALISLFANKSRNPHPSPAIEAALGQISAATQLISGELSARIEAHRDVPDEDIVRAKVDQVFAGKVGAPPTAEWLKQAEIDAQSRYEREIPPGYKDNPKKEIFYDRGLNYQARFGDYIIWKQIIDHVNNNKIRDIVLITDDRKEDWWNIVSGKTVGPRTELIDEMHRLGEVSKFQVYKSDQFLSFALDSGIFGVKAESVVQVRDATRPTLLESVEQESEAAPKQIVSTQFLVLREHLLDRFPGATVSSPAIGGLKFHVDDILDDVVVHYLRFAEWRTPGSARRVLQRAFEARASVDGEGKESQDVDLYVFVPLKSAPIALRELSDIWTTADVPTKVHVLLAIMEEGDDGPELRTVGSVGHNGAIQ